MKLTPNFYRDRVCLNVLAGSKDNAREIYDAAEGQSWSACSPKTIRTSPARWPICATTRS